MKNAEQQSNSTFNIHIDVQNRLRTWRRRLLWQRLLHVLAAIMVVLLIANWLGTPLTTQLQQVLAVALVGFALLWLGPGWRGLNTESFLEHLNRRFESFEESAQLVLQDPSGLKPLQRFQRERALGVYRKNLAQVNRWQSPINYRPVLVIGLACLLLLLLTEQLSLVADRILSKSDPASASAAAGANHGITGIIVRVVPPAYTGLAMTESGKLDLEIPQGSSVEWSFNYETNGNEYALQLSDNRQIVLTPDNDGRLHANAVIDSTGLYRLVKVAAEEQQAPGAIYSIAVVLDRPPVIRMIEPEVSTLEIPKSGPAAFTSRALIKDDYGVGTVEILASVAKGSGEGVKFRDEKLQFDQSTETQAGPVYHKTWDLQALGMEPGDEVYFTVLATDNRLPDANTGRSETLIVRWMEDQEPAIAADGLAIDFIPEYFKSQRQIIIDTEQLIEDKPHIALQTFRDTSYETGQAQADLKQKYGQYLGDEFGEGPGIHADSQHEAGGDSDDDHDQHDDDHGDEINSADLGGNLNSMADIVRLFGHDHGDPEIGPITRRNPVALMKRAVNEMWQAEKHLMQAEPELALPFEYEAYKYLKLARQADRIYVKRLGFEPPPVSEERRLSGELGEISSYRTSAPQPLLDTGGEIWVQQLLKNVYQVLTEHSSEHELNMEQRELIGQLGREFTGWSQQRAALIRYAATLEKLSLGGRLTFDDCETCLEELASVIWNLIDEGAGQLGQRKTTWYGDDGMIEGYQRVLKQYPDGGAVAGDTNGARQ